MTTFITLIGFGVLLVLSLMLYAVALWLGARWTGINGLTLKRSCAMSILIWAVQTPIGLALLRISPSTVAESVYVLLGQLLVLIAVPCIALRLLCAARRLQAFLAWLPTLGASIVGVLLFWFIVNPFCWETFTMPTNSMAPTILGEHWQGICPRCGEPAFASVPPERLPGPRIPPDGLVMNCGSELRHCLVSAPDTTTRPGDRFLVNKMLRPRRWDIVVFRVPSDPETLHAKRLVGLPGEEIVIRDGAVWADGQRSEPPESLRGIEYFADAEGTPLPPDMKMWGHESRPALLGDDECFVLGDFPARSKDSRLYEGAPGHPPYAVPEDYIEGVVTHIYWPPSRWRTFR